MRNTSSFVVVGLAALLAFTAAGCVTAPVMRPVGPPPVTTFETGVGAEGIVTQDSAGIGGILWGNASFTDGADIILRGHAAQVFPLEGNGEQSTIAGGSAGVRLRFPIFPGTQFGVELLGDYLRIGPPSAVQRFASAIVGFSAAEEALPGLWLYTNVQLGLAVPLHANPTAPFQGIVEIPFGIVWSPVDWFMLIGEFAAFAPEIQNQRAGLVGTVGAGFRF
jgi:hypothetical protein